MEEILNSFTFKLSNAIEGQV